MRLAPWASIGYLRVACNMSPGDLCRRLLCRYRGQAQGLPARRFQDLAARCADSKSARFALAELNTWLASLVASELLEAVGSPPPVLTPYFANYVAAMVEQACTKHGVVPPSWTRAIAPLAEPVFGSTLMRLRLHLLTHSPASFRRRNIFIDSGVGTKT